MRVLLRNKDGEKRALNAHLAGNRWLEIRPPPKEMRTLCFDLSKEEVEQFLAGKTLFENKVQEGKWPWTVRLVR